MNSFFAHQLKNLLFSTKLKYDQAIDITKEAWPIPFNIDSEKLKSVITNIIVSNDALKFSYFFNLS